MEKQFPKNVRQVGNVSDTPKIYVEDYVDTYLNQIKEQVKEQWAGAFLVGEKCQINEQECIFVTGAVFMQREEDRDTNVEISDEIVKAAKKECGDYFPGLEIVGWMLVETNGSMGLNNSIIKIHEKLFKEKNSLFIQKHPIENEENYFVYKFHDLMQVGGHYVFYEKNPAMQNYMINVRRQIGVTPSEMVEDRAAKDFRNTIRGRMEAREQRNSSRLAYATSVLLVVMVLAIGISAMNNYDKINAVQNSIETLSESVRQNENAQQREENNEDNIIIEETGAGQASQNQSDDVQNADADREQSSDAAQTKETAVGMEPQVSTIQEELSSDSNQEYYVVQKGDTLDSISQKFYGTIKETDAICKMNGLSDGNLIFIGQKLLLP